MSARKYLDEVQARADKATPGPWEVKGNGAQPYASDGIVANCETQIHNDDDEAGLESDERRGFDNADFIAAARTDVPKLAAMLRIALDALERVKDWEVMPSSDYRDKYAIPDGERGPSGLQIIRAALAEIDRRAEER